MVVIFRRAIRAVSRLIIQDGPAFGRLAVPMPVDTCEERAMPLSPTLTFPSLAIILEGGRR
jgi:hypothetical protein